MVVARTSGRRTTSDRSARVRGSGHAVRSARPLAGGQLYSFIDNRITASEVLAQENEETTQIIRPAERDARRLGRSGKLEPVQPQTRRPFPRLSGRARRRLAEVLNYCLNRSRSFCDSDTGGRCRGEFGRDGGARRAGRRCRIVGPWEGRVSRIAGMRRNAAIKNASGGLGNQSLGCAVRHA